MKYIHLDGNGMLACLANALEYFDFDTEDFDIALGMNAPWLFLQEENQYIAGQSLYTPSMLNLYLLPRGFRMSSATVSKPDIPAYLRSHHPAIVPLKTNRERKHPVLCTDYANGRYIIVNTLPENSTEPRSLSLSRPMLLHRLDDTVCIFTLQQCEPQSIDFIPYLTRSYNTLTEYEHTMMDICKMTVSREKLRSLHKPLMRALFVDMLPMALLLQQPVLYHELRLLNHDYRHVFTCNSGETVTLFERLPRSSITECISWLHENIVDRLYDHGLTDDQVAAALSKIE